jgi:hypothetical protein
MTHEQGGHRALCKWAREGYVPAAFSLRFDRYQSGAAAPRTDFGIGIEGGTSLRRLARPLDTGATTSPRADGDPGIGPSDVTRCTVCGAC